jgi:hypothetical protein
MPFAPRRRAHRALSFTVLALLGAVAPTPGRADARADAAQALQAGSAGDARAAARAAALYEQLSAASPEDPVLLAYAGAATALTGRDASTPLEAMTLTDAGLARLDKAVKRVGPQLDPPRRFEAWLVAANTYLSVPDDVFHRLADGKAVLAQALADPALPHLPPSIRAQLARLEARAAQAEHRPQDELAALRRALALEPSGPAAAKVQARIAELSR